MSSIISGRDPETSAMPPDLAGQVSNVFKQIKLCVEAAGGSVDDIIKVNFWMKDPATGRAALNGEWARMFPDPDSRPARHTLALGANNPNHLTCDFTAVIGG
jgi:2-iminobutanoate/2-iminopropanoate deaminase